MAKRKTLIDQFILKFDYSDKVKFVIFIAAFTAIFGLVFLFKTQNIFLSNLNFQKKGIEYQERLNNLIGNLVQLKINLQDKTDKSSSTDLIKSIDQIFFELESHNQQIEYLLFSSLAENIQDFQQQFNHTEELWKILKLDLLENQPMKEKEYKRFFESIENLIVKTRIIFQLSLNFDSNTSHLLDLYNVKFPQMQMQIFQAFFLIKEDKLNKLGKVEVDAQLKNQVDGLKENNLEVTQAFTDMTQIHSTIKKEIMTSTIEADLKKYITTSEKFIDLINTFNQQAEQKTSENFLQDLLLLKIQSILTSLKVQNELFNFLQTNYKERISSIKIKNLLSTAFILIGIFIVLMIYMTRVIRRPLSEFKHAAELLAEGNFSVRVPITSKDEVADMSNAFNQVVGFFEKVMIDADEIANKLTKHSTNIFTTSKQLEMSLVQQDELINQITTKAKLIYKSEEDFARSLQEVNNAATLTTHLAQLGRVSLTEMEMIMQQMAHASTHIVMTLSSLEEKVGNINQVINTIVKIADQINLLSLNTAIRSSKKGMRHAGFSVIAQKIKELADQTAYVTLDIEEMVEQIIRAVKETVTEVDNFSSKIQKQLEIASEIRELLKKMIDHTQMQVSSFEIVNQGMQEQTTRVAQIQDSIQKIISAAQKTTNSVRTLHFELEYLYHSTHNLQMTTRKFTSYSVKLDSLSMESSA